MSHPRRALKSAPRRGGFLLSLTALALSITGSFGAVASTASSNAAPEPETNAAFVQRADHLNATVAQIEKAQFVAVHSARQESLSVESSEIVMLAKKQGYGDGVFLRPAPGNIVSPFGYRIHPVFRVRMFHDGIDIANQCGTPLLAADDGVVTKTGFMGGAGNAVYLEHQKGLVTAYFHLSSIGVKVGDRVKRGDTLGKMGTTGTSTGCHLHFQVEVDDQPVDPVPYLTKKS